MKVVDLISNALQEMGALAQGETARAEDASFALSKLNRIRDQWAARKVFTYSVGFSGTSYVLTPNKNPHLIGPTGSPNPDFIVAQRPVRVENANIVLTGSSPLVRVPLRLRDDDWWANNRVQTVTSTIPTDLFYSADWPNGSLYLWPAPSSGYALELVTWALINKFALTDNFSLPPGYEEALTLTLAESLCAPFGAQLNPLLMKDAQRARAAIQGNNDESPRISTDLAAGNSDHYRGNYSNGWFR